MTRKRICVFNTGGTISCVGDPLCPMPAVEFAAACEAQIAPLIAAGLPHVELVFDARMRFPASENGMLDSTNLQPSDWCLIAGAILDTYADYDGFVVLHGTDTMDFTASALPFLLNAFDKTGDAIAALSKPVILTGSQLPMFHRASGGALTLNFNTDAFQNLCGAVGAAAMNVPEVAVYFDAKLYRGPRVMKVSTNAFAAFESPKFPALAEGGIELRLDAGRILPLPTDREASLDAPAALSRAKVQLAGIRRAISAYPVMQLSAFPAQYDAVSGQSVMANLIDACVRSGIRGVVLEAYGAGNFPSGAPDAPQNGGVYQALKRANDAGIVILLCSRVIGGAVDSSAYASGAWLADVGALDGSDMTPMAGFAKMLVLLSAAEVNGWSIEVVRQLIQTDLAGEMG